MSFLISDAEIKNEIENLSKEQRPINVSSTLIKPFEAMDISDGSYIFDNFVVMVPHIKNHLEIMDLQYKKLKELS
ncbi:hypothetical protein Q3A90_10970 [Priestia megaterium]|uniref:hypothetical protein n=1 Tax=Priestia megaterium TaxID=1404 RepID=UPI00267659DB|nr:hypothetical protein [Priestia megaterium]WKU25348.1 hypothetical protein Q3A90_10970 [Priestia megaterium]